ncbi:MAG TPA: DUF433 domain-containing protein [Thermomicrobiales bacterium]|nr:DUF433 domain-containing protein [Thermomicrobiales bacterium]
MDWRDYITVDPLICHGQACIKGTRVMVSQAAVSYAADLARENHPVLCALDNARFRR